MVKDNCNSWVTEILGEFMQYLPQNYPHVVIGSATLISYTSKIGYERQIHDVDIICQSTGFAEVASKLISLGYEQTTFINKRMPFYNQLIKLAGSKYFRFVKGGRALEIVTSDLINKDGNIRIELYPNFKISVPDTSIVNANFGGREFKAASPEALYCIYSVGYNTWGRFVSAKNSQVRQDLQNLRKIINRDRLKEFGNQVRIEIGPVKFKLPLLLIR